MLSSKKSQDILQKRIPKNPKYDNVESTIDTGASLSRQMKRIEEIKQNYKIRKDELFKRMKITTFVQLVLNVAEINNHLYFDIDPNNDSNNTNNENSKDDIISNDGSVTTQRSTFQSVISGIGELDVNEQPINDIILPDAKGDYHPVSEEDMPYLLLDVREQDDYNKCHIIKSYPYPSAMICRSCNFETKQMLACRNHTGKIIILYDEDERIAPRVADTLVQRGYDNLFLLSGGLRLAYKLFPNGLITGTIPQSIVEFCRQKPRKPSGTNSNASSIITTKSSIKDANNSINKPDPPIVQSEFTMQDLAQLSLALDSLLDGGKSATSSIYSRASSKFGGSLASRQGAPSVTGSSATLINQVDHKKPFKV